MKNLTFLFFFFFSHLSYSGFYPSDPIKYRQKIQKHVKRLVDKRDPQVFFFGDDHKVNHSPIYSDLFHEILKQAPQTDCLFLEMPGEYFTGPIAHYLKTGDFSQIGEKYDLLNQIYNSKKNLVAQKEKQILLDLAKKYHMKVFPIDRLPTRTTVLTILDMVKDYQKAPTRQKAIAIRQFQIYHYGYLRNQYIANEMDSLFNKQVCQRAISVNGNSHLENQGQLPLYNVVALPIQLILSREYNKRFGMLVIR